MQVDDPALLDFLAEIIVDIPARDFTPQALSVVISVYAGAHRRRSLEVSMKSEEKDPSKLPPATGMLEHLAEVASQIPPHEFEARHVRTIVQAYFRAGVRGKGLFQVMSRAWETRWGSGTTSVYVSSYYCCICVLILLLYMCPETRWGSGFKTEVEMKSFFSSLDNQDSQKGQESDNGASETKQSPLANFLPRWPRR
jgi:hypothetical protein